MNPFKRIPAVMTVVLVLSAICWIHVLPASYCVSGTISLRDIATGHTIDFYKHCCLEFRAYLQTHESGDNTIITENNSVAISLGPTSNSQGIWRFMRLASGRKIAFHKWTALPIPNQVIRRVCDLARCYP